MEEVNQKDGATEKDASNSVPEDDSTLRNSDSSGSFSSHSKLEKGNTGTPSLKSTAINPFKMTPTDSWPGDSPDAPSRPILAPPRFGANPLSGPSSKLNPWATGSPFSSVGPAGGQSTSGESKSTFRFKPAVLSTTFGSPSGGSLQSKRPVEDSSSEGDELQRVPDDAPESNLSENTTDTKRLRVSSLSSIPEENNSPGEALEKDPESCPEPSLTSTSSSASTTPPLESEPSPCLPGTPSSVPMFVPLSAKAESKTAEESPARVNGVATTSPPLSTRASNSGFIFGQNLHSKVSGLSSNSSSAFSNGETGFSSPLSSNPFASAVSNLAAGAAAEASSSAVSQAVADGAGKSLSETSRELSLKRESLRTKYEEVEVVTGEENEKNVLQMNCKLYSWTNGSWQERGRGLLRLNDREIRDELHSRLVVRTQGTLTVMLNAQIWSEMSVEKPNDKTIRFTASDSDGQPKIYLVTGSPKDITLLHNSLEYRVAAARSQTLDEKERDQEDPDEDHVPSLSV